MDGGYEGRTTGCGFDCAANLKVRRVSEGGGRVQLSSINWGKIEACHKFNSIIQG